MNDKATQQSKTNAVWELAKRHKGKVAATAVLTTAALAYANVDCGVGCPPHTARIPGTPFCFIPC